jgi:hypothetical protein
MALDPVGLDSAVSAVLGVIGTLGVLHWRCRPAERKGWLRLVAEIYLLSQAEASGERERRDTLTAAVAAVAALPSGGILSDRRADGAALTIRVEPHASQVSQATRCGDPSAREHAPDEAAEQFCRTPKPNWSRRAVPSVGREREREGIRGMPS